MSKWQYKVHELAESTGHSPGALEKALNALGDEGWEFVALLSPIKRMKTFTYEEVFIPVLMKRQGEAVAKG